MRKTTKKEIGKIKNGNSIMYHDRDMAVGSTHGGIMFVDFDGNNYVEHGKCGNSSVTQEEISESRVVEIIETEDWDFL